MAESFAGDALAELFVSVTYDMNTLRRSTREALRHLEQAQSRMADIGREMALKISLPIAAFATASVVASASAEEIKSKFDAVFKDLADGSEKWAAGFAGEANRSKFEMMGFLSTLQDTFVPLGFARDKSAEFSRKLVELAVDLGSFNDVADAEVVRDLQSAMVGNSEAVRKYGIVLQQTQLNQELLNMGVAGGMKAANQLQKAQARMNIIFRSTTDAQGDAIRTSGSLTNSFRGMMAGLKDLRVEFGNMLKETLGLANVTQKIGDLFRGLSEIIRGMSPQAKKFTTAMVLIGAAIGPVMIGLAAMMKTVPLLGVALTTAFAGPAGPALALAAAIASVATAYVTLTTKGDTFFERASNGFRRIGLMAKTGFTQMLNGIKPVFVFAEAGLKAFAIHAGAATQATGLFFATLFENIKGHMKWFKDNWKDILNPTVDAVDFQPVRIGDELEEIFTDAQKRASDAMNKVFFGGSMIDKVADTFEPVKVQAVEAGKKVREALDIRQFGVEQGLHEFEKSLGKLKNAITPDTFRTNFSGMLSGALEPAAAGGAPGTLAGGRAEGRVVEDEKGNKILGEIEDGIKSLVKNTERRLSIFKRGG